MAKNGVPGMGRIGAVRQRSQLLNPRPKIWTKCGPDGPVHGWQEGRSALQWCAEGALNDCTL
jgi:hypothetical protein